MLYTAFAQEKELLNTLVNYYNILYLYHHINFLPYEVGDTYQLFRCNLLKSSACEQ